MRVMPSVVPQSPCTAVAPSATITRGFTRPSCCTRYGMHEAISSGSGLRLLGGRHLTMLAT